MQHRRWYSILLVLLAACQPRPAAHVLLTRPEIQTRATHDGGSVMSGPVASTAAVSVAAAESWIVETRWVALSKWPTTRSIPLSARSTLLIADRSSAPLLGSARLTAGVRLVEGADAPAFQQAVLNLGDTDAVLINAFSSALPPQVTAVFEADVPSPGPTTPGETLNFQISAEAAPPSPTGLFRSALTIGGNRGPAANGTVGTPQTETVFFEQTASQSKLSFALLQRLPSAVPGGLVLAVLVEARPATHSPADQSALAQCAADVQRSTKRLARQSGLFPLQISAPAGITSAIASLGAPQQQRASLTYLADQGEAPLCLDVVLVADNATLADLSQRVRRWANRPERTDADFAPQALGWALDHAAFDLLTSLADSPEGGKLTPELAVVLTQSFGEAARHTAALDEVAHGVAGEADLHNRIVAQNLLFLTDPSPAARVRAFDWLNSRHLAPVGFDPLGTARQRRLAMDRATSQP